MSDQLRNSLFIFVEQHNVAGDTSGIGPSLSLVIGQKGDRIMTTATLQLLSGSSLFAGFLDWARAAAPEAAGSRDDQLSHRAFISEKLIEYPDAMYSEYGMSTLMSHYPGEF